MPRFFADSITGGEAVFIEDAAHISKTLRMSPGDGIVAMDGSGGVFACVITKVDKKGVTARIENTLPPQGETATRITVYQGICRSHRFDYVAQKCTELGVSRIVPLLLHRCETRDYNPAKLQRFQKIAREAAKQSGRSIIPTITEPTDIAGIAGHELLLCPYELEQRTRLKDIIAGGSYGDIGIVIGPEGGLEDWEAEQLRSLGGQTITLGKRILRTETAAAALTAMLLYELDEI